MSTSFPKLNTSKVFPSLFVTISKCTGVYPLNSRFKANCARATYSLLLVLVCNGIQLSSPYVAVFFEKCCKLKDPSPPILAILNKSSLLTKFIRACLPIIMACAPSVSILNALWKYKYYFPNYIKFLDISDAILKTGTSLYVRHRRFSITYTAFCLLMDVSIKISTLITLFLSGTAKDFIFVWIVLLFSVDFIGFVAEVQLIVMVYALKIRFEEINKRLEDLFSFHNVQVEYRIKNFADKWRSEQALSKILFKSNDIQTAKARRNTNMLYLNTIHSTRTLQVRPVERQILRKEFLYRTDFESSFGRESEKKNLSSTLYLLRISHRNLSAAFYNLNAMFEHMLLGSLFTRFLMILGNSYFVIFGFDNGFILSHRWDVSYWLLKCLFRFVSQLVMSDILSETAQSTAQILSSRASGSLTKKTQEEMEYFRREIESRNLVVTSAFDLFILKRQLITAAVAASATYIVTLVQLH